MNSPVLFFDGVCNLCNGLVQFVIKKEKNLLIKFSTLQSESGQLYLKQFNLDGKDLDSILFIENNIVYAKSEAVFKIANYLNSPWSSIKMFRFLPRAFNDFIYDFVAKHRYRVFGKSVTCMVPETTTESRFLK